jgi:hypothetical protein
VLWVLDISKLFMLGTLNHCLGLNTQRHIVLFAWPKAIFDPSEVEALETTSREKNVTSLTYKF